MKFIRYRYDGQDRTGFLKTGFVVDLFKALELTGGKSERFPYKPVEQLGTDPDAMDAVRSAFSHIEAPGPAAVSSARVQFLPPVTRPGKVLCAGLNFPPFDAGPDFEPPAYPVLFHKAASALTGHGSPILLPKISSEVDYEGELAVVIGRRAKQVSAVDAPGYIAGYTIANDIGARDVQRRSSQWTSGKMFDTFCPLGPALVTPEDVPDPGDLKITTRLNEETVQDGSTKDMIFGPWALVSYISELTTLLPGDIILTGSPKTAGTRPDPRSLLRPGDVISVEIECLGMLTNPVEKEEP